MVIGIQVGIFRNFTKRHLLVLYEKFTEACFYFNEKRCYEEASTRDIERKLD